MVWETGCSLYPGAHGAGTQDSCGLDLGRPALTLYVDSSALVKKYLEESESATLAAAIDAANSVATSIVAYPEVCAALTRALREHRIDAESWQEQIHLLDNHWPDYAVVQLDDANRLDAGSLVAQHAAHGLRGFDAIHLAAARVVADGTPGDVTFACWDLRLWRAARDEGFVMLPSTEPGS